MQEACRHTIVNFNQTALQNRSYSILHNFFFFQIAFQQKALLFFNLEMVEKKNKFFFCNSCRTEEKCASFTKSTVQENWTIHDKLEDEDSI